MNDDFGVPVELDRQVFTIQLHLRGAYRDSLRVGTGLVLCWPKPRMLAGTDNSSTGWRGISKRRHATHDA